jgi:hypothetical protein
MSELKIDYIGARVPVRDDLREAHIAILEHLRQPGSWFSGAERLAIAAESRNALACELCVERKTSLSPEPPLDDSVAMMTADLRTEIDLVRFRSSVNTLGR